VIKDQRSEQALKKRHTSFIGKIERKHKKEEI